MTVNERIGSLANLGFALKEDNDARKYAIGKAYFENKWFTEDQVLQMINAISGQYLDYDLLSAFSKRYQLADNIGKPQTVGLIPAGNIPLVGFHDLLCILLSGHHAVVKMSDKDKVLLPFLMQLLEPINLEMSRRVQFVSRLENFNAVIATGSNNTAKVFHKYFEKYPNIIRKNRTGIAILSGQEQDEQLEGLAEDIFTYYGLGCRNISKIYVPNDYNFDRLGKILNNYKEIVLHNKYKNNFDYNLAIQILNKSNYINVGSLILVEDKKLHSRIASLHYEYYDDLDKVSIDLKNNLAEIQCITSLLDIKGLKVLPFGEAQKPGLIDYADGEDTMAFLQRL